MSFKENLKLTLKKAILTIIIFIFLMIYSFIKTVCIVNICTNPNGCCPSVVPYLFLTIIIPILFYILVSYYEFKNKS